MRIAYFTDTYLPQVNGVTNTLSRLVSYLDKKGVENIVFAPGEQGEHSYETAVDTSFSLRFFLYPECRLTIPNLYRISNVLHSFKPDLIHCVTPFNLGLTGLKYGRDHSLPVVASYHTNFDQYLDYYNLRFLQNVIWEFFQWFHNQCLVNYVPSRDTLGILKKRNIGNLEIWSRGVDTSLYHPAKRKEELRAKWQAANKLVLLYVGRLGAEKNLELLINTYRALDNRYPGRLHLVITGEGPLAPVLREEAPPSVTFTGYQKGEALAEIYASADIFAFPSCTETFGNVVLEAMASGLPAAGLAAGGVRETIRHGKNGLLSLPGNEGDFAEALGRLIEDNNYRHALAQGARAYAEKQSWEAILAKLLSSYERVTILEEVIKANEYQKLRVVDKIKGILENLEGKTIAVLGLTFKPGTDDLRKAPSLQVMAALKAEGATVKAYDPLAERLCRESLQDAARISADIYEILAGSEGAIIMTEWEEIRQLDLERARQEMAFPLIVDGRNVFYPEQMRQAGFIYSGIGR